MGHIFKFIIFHRDIVCCFIMVFHLFDRYDDIFYVFFFMCILIYFILFFFFYFSFLCSSICSIDTMTYSMFSAKGASLSIFPLIGYSICSCVISTSIAGVSNINPLSK